MINKKLLAVFASILLLIGAFTAVLSPNLGVDNFLALLYSQTPGDFQLLGVTSTCSNGLPRVSATWTASENAKSYVLERKYPWPSDWEITGETSELSFTDATWESGYDSGIYTYRARAINGRKSRPSESQQITITPCDTISPNSDPAPTPTLMIPTPAPIPESTSVTTPTPVIEPVPATAPPATTPISIPTPIPAQTLAPTPEKIPTPASQSDPTLVPTPTPESTLAPTPAPVLVSASTLTPSVNLIKNPSLETDADNNNIPDTWAKGSWGKNKSVFSYPVPGINGGRAAKITVTSYSSGDAKWYFADIPVTPDQTYRFVDQYLSNAQTQVLARYKKPSGAVSYATIASLPSTLSTWKTFSGTFTPPTGTVSVTIFHLIFSNGSLTIDETSLASESAITPMPAPQQPTPAPISEPAPVPVPTRIQWGAYVGDTLSEAANFESLVGRAMNMQAVFVGWGVGNGSFPSEYGPSVRNAGKTLVIFWEQYGATLDQINSGQFDSYIAQFATDSKTYGGSIILAPLHEMNGNWDPWDGTVGSNTPAKVIAAWKRIHDAFNGVANVKFAWDVNNVSVPDTAANSIASYYPGDTYVDYVAVDGFNFGNPWQTFNSVFNSALTQLKTYHKPIYILSMASAAGNQKAAWITDALTIQIPKYPEIAGWVWFNQNKEQNWLVNSDLNSLAAFKAALSK